jgi:hypothetical protein
VSYHESLRLRPDQLWYCFQGRRDESFVNHLDPEKYRNGHLTLSVEQNEAGEVVVTRDYRFDLEGRQLSSRYEFVASFAHGGNIVRYSRSPMEGAPAGVNGFGTRGEFQWERLGDGRFYCQSCRYCQYEEDPDDPVVRFEMTVDEFDPNPTIPSDQFTLAGLKLEPGTVVEDKTGRGRVYKFGNETETLTTEKLNRLVEEQRERGFAAPGRAAAQ